jgi:C4-dicarboxylate transporter, DctQ subunit
MQLFDRVVDYLAGAGAVLVIGMMAVVCLEVIMRYIVHRPQIWVVETSEYMLVILTFLAATWILRAEGHVKVDFVYNRLSYRTQALLGVISSIIGIFVCLILFIYGTIVVWGMLRTWEVDAKSQIGMPKGPLLAVIPVCSFFLIIQFIRRVRKYLRASGKGKNG